MITSADEFVRLRTSSDPKDYLRSANEGADDATWIEVIDRFPGMRSWVAQNKTISESVVRILFSLDDDEVALVLAMKRVTPQDVLALLSRHRSEVVRAAVARNPRVATEVIQTLVDDDSAIVREAAIQRVQ